MKKRNNIQISKELRIKTLIPILEGKSLDLVANVLDVSVKTLKARLTLLYKYYGVKNRIELMALYATVPTPFYRFIKGKKQAKINVKVSKVTYRDSQERSIELPMGEVK